MCWWNMLECSVPGIKLKRTCCVLEKQKAPFRSFFYHNTHYLSTDVLSQSFRVSARWPSTSCVVEYKQCDLLFTMLFHRPLASSSCPFMVKWKQSWVKKVMSIFPFCPETLNTHRRRWTNGVTESSSCHNLEPIHTDWLIFSILKCGSWWG